MDHTWKDDYEPADSSQDTCTVKDYSWTKVNDKQAWMARKICATKNVWLCVGSSSYDDDKLGDI